MKIDSMKAGFVYSLECVGQDGKVKWREEAHNLLPDVGRDYIMNAAMNAGAQYSTWYIGLYENARTPLASDDMASLLTDCGESSAYGTNRLELVDALADGLFSNLASPAEFTFTSAATIRGGFISSGSVVDNTSGLLLSAVLLPTAKSVAAGDILRVTAGWSLTSV